MESKIAPPQYETLRGHVANKLGLPGQRLPILIGIDGRDGAGKSSLASWLAWQFGLSTVYLDLFIVMNSRPIAWREEHLKQAIASRLDRSSPLPIVVEGVLLLNALKSVNRGCDFLVFVENENYSGSDALREQLECYFRDKQVRERADFVLSWSEDRCAGTQ